MGVGRGWQESLGRSEKHFEKSPSAPPQEKILPTPMCAANLALGLFGLTRVLDFV